MLISKEGVNIDSVAYDTKVMLYGSGTTENENLANADGMAIPPITRSSQSILPFY